MRRVSDLHPAEWLLMGGVSALMITATAVGWWQLAWTEVLGFVTGGVCVWLVVREHVWNWPVGLANNVFFFALFAQSRLFADMALQVVYLGLGVWGWAHWLFGGADRTELPISRATRAEWLALAIFLPAGTWGLRALLLVVNGAAPFFDALTTILSLCAQYLLCQKRLENWFFWIAADVIYIPLYFSRGLALTAVLYMVFLAMCCIGLRAWLRHWRAIRA